MLSRKIKHILMGDNNLESLFLMVKIQSTSIIIECTYITNRRQLKPTHNMQIQVQDIFIKYLDNKYIIPVDYNLRNITWSMMLHNQ